MKIKRILAVLLSLATALSLAACASGASGSSATSSSSSKSGAASSTQKKVITVMRPLFEAQPPQLDSPAELAIEQKLNVDFQCRWVPTGTFTEVFNTTLATKDIPKIIVAPSSLTVNPGFMKYCNADVFWEVGDKIKSHKSLFENEVMTENSLIATSINGKNYIVPSIAAAARAAVIYRKDWADKVGAPVPNTIENFYKMAQLFTENDPDGNGKKDTYGYSYIDDADKELAYAGFTSIAVANGAPNNWGKDANGKLYPYFESDGYMKTLDFFRDMYKKGYMNEDFYLVKGNDKYSAFIAGKAGMMMTSGQNAAVPGGKYDPLIQANPNAKIAYSLCFIQPNGKEIINSVVSAGSLAGSIFPKASCTEEEVDFIIGLYAKMREDPEMDKILNFGVKDKHYTVNGNKIDITAEQITARKNDGSQDAFVSWIPSPIVQKDYGQTLTPMQAIQKEIVKKEQFALMDASAGKMDGDMLAKLTSISTIISDARVKYILGKIDAAGFKAAVKAWKDAGGQKIIDDLNK